MNWMFFLQSLWVAVLICFTLTWLGTMLKETIHQLRDAGLFLITRWFKEQEDFLARIGSNERRQLDRLH